MRIVLVDDHPVVRAGLAALLETDPRLTVVAEAADAAAAVAAVESLAGADDGTPDLVLMDLQLGDGPNGIAATRTLRATHPEVQVLVLTTFDTDADVLGALDAGAVGYVLKDSPTDALIGAVVDAAHGRSVLAPEVQARLVQRVARPGGAVSARETEILALLATGASNRQIARALFISESTVKTHLVHLYGKLGVDNRTAAISTARERRIIR